MTIRRVTSPHVPEPPPERWSNAIRAGDFKLIEFFNDMHVELYNLKLDAGEVMSIVSTPSTCRLRLAAGSSPLNTGWVIERSNIRSSTFIASSR